MIKGKVKTEEEYRAIPLDSSTSLKDFSMDRKKYYKKYILGEKVEEKYNFAINMGKIVETLLMEREEFDNRFYLSTLTSIPTGLMLNFVENLYSKTLEYIDEESVVITKDFSEIAKEAYDCSEFKISFDAVIKKFIGSDAEVYYKEIREIRSKGLTVVTTQDVTSAERIVEGLKNNMVTCDIVNLVNSAKWSVYDQLKIESYQIDNLNLKSMLDKVIVNHHDRTIQLYDLKCTWSVENFLEEYYLYRRAYIQAYLYHRAVMSLALTKDRELYGYEVLNPMFIVCDSINYYNPLIYTLTDDDMNDAYMGFDHKGKVYPGVKTIIDDIKWAKENDIWNISKVNYLNNGLVNIR